MIQGAKQATVVSLALLGFFHVVAARESVGVPILLASLVLWWAGSETGGEHHHRMSSRPQWCFVEVLRGRRRTCRFGMTIISPAKDTHLVSRKGHTMGLPASL